MNNSNYFILMFIILAFLLIAIPTFVYPCSPCHASDINSEVVQTAKKYVGIVETPKNSNRGPEIDKFHDYVGLPYGNPYCAMFVLFTYKETYGKGNKLPKMPRVNGLWKWAGKNPLTVKTYTTKGLIWGAQNIQPGDIIIWKSGTNVSLSSNWNGHTGISQYGTKPDKVKTIEANTTPGASGNQRDGGGIYERDRKYNLGSAFEIIGFVRVN